MTTKPLTETENTVLQFIVRYRALNGFSPTIREICNGTNYSSPNYINHILYRLKDKGYITFRERQARTIVVTHLPEGA